MISSVSTAMFGSPSNATPYNTPGLPSSTAGITQLQEADTTRSQFMTIMAGVGSPERLARLYQQYPANAPLHAGDTVRSILDTLLGCHKARLTTSPKALMDLRDLNLKGIDASELNLSNTDLSGSILDNANLTGAILNHSVLDQTSCIGTNMQNAHLFSASLHRVNLSQANLTNCQAHKAWLTQTTIADATLHAINLNCASISACNITRTDATRSEWIGAVVHNTTFTNTNLTEANFTSANMQGNTLCHTQLTSAQFNQTTVNDLLSTTKVTHAQLRQMKGDPIIRVGQWQGMPPSNRQWALLDDPDVPNAVLQEMDLADNLVSPLLYQRMITMNHPSLPHVGLFITPDQGVAPPSLEDTALEQHIQQSTPQTPIRCLMTSQSINPWTAIWSSSLWAHAVLSRYHLYQNPEQTSIIRQVARAFLDFLTQPTEEVATQQVVNILGNIHPTHPLWQAIISKLPQERWHDIEARVFSLLPNQSPYLHHVVEHCCQMLKAHHPDTTTILRTLARLTPHQFKVLGHYLSPQQVAYCQSLPHQYNMHLMITALKPSHTDDTPFNRLMMRVMEVISPASEPSFTQWCQQFPS